MVKFDEFMEEVQQDMRHAKIEKYWKKYGKQAIVVCSVVLGAAVLNTLYENRQDQLSIMASDKFITAQNALIQGKYNDALVIFEDLSKTAPKTYQVLSLFSKVGTLLKQETKETTQKAIETLKEIEASSNVDKDLKVLAKLIRYGQEIGILEKGSSELEALRLSVDGIIKDNTVWSYLAKELKGLILYKVGAEKEAAEMFISLVQDTKTPEAIRLRSQLMAQVLSSKIAR
ncbi:MAG: tetratricopeptide repeat protein [Proteobacteria bacterium]|nr:tetratricopeptide repeat protein [Pseudomonadota bacterium]